MRDVRKEMESAEEATFSIWESQDAELTDLTNLVWITFIHLMNTGAIQRVSLPPGIVNVQVLFTAASLSQNPRLLYTKLLHRESQCQSQWQANMLQHVIWMCINWWLHGCVVSAWLKKREAGWKVEGRLWGWDREKRQVYINTRGGLMQDPHTTRQLEKQSMQDREPGLEHVCCFSQSARLCVCVYSIHILPWCSRALELSVY